MATPLVSDELWELVEPLIPKVHSELRRRGIQAKIAWPKAPHGLGLGRERRIVERTIAGLHQYRRLRVRHERSADFTRRSCTSRAG